MNQEQVPAVKSESKALIKIVKVKRPISEQVAFYRIKAAHPNRAARGWKGAMIPSFSGRFLIAESSDFISVGSADVERFVDSLGIQQFTTFEIVADQQDE